MKSIGIALGCVLFNCACAHEEAQPAQDPTSTPVVIASNSDAWPDGGATNAQSTTTGVGTATAPSVSNSPSPVAQNDRRNDTVDTRTPNASDQGNGSSETSITASIRKAIMDDGSLSFAAKNISIITIGSKVTLRGSVKNAQEMAKISSLAKRTRGVSAIDDQLETAP